MIIAHMETQHFVFTALGDTEAQALDALKRCWDKHAAQIGAGLFASDQALDEYGVACFELEAGDCARNYCAMGVQDQSEGDDLAKRKREQA